MQITYSKRHTKNLGNYENLTVEIGVQDKINYEDGETFDAGFVRIRELVNFKLKKEFEKVGGM
jgi:hypothetical protein